MVLRKYTQVLISLLLLSFSSFSQKKGFLEFSGKCIKDYKPIKDARVSVYSGPTKIAEIKTTKNGQFMFDLDFGQDYKVVFSKSGSPEMYLLIQASKCPHDKPIFPSYEIDVTFFDFRDIEINEKAFQSPISKIIYDSKGIFIDDEEYLTAFFENIYDKPSEIKKKEELKILRESQELYTMVKMEEAKEIDEKNNNSSKEERNAVRNEIIYSQNKFTAFNDKPSKTSSAENEISLLLRKSDKQKLREINKYIKLENEKEFLNTISFLESNQSGSSIENKKIITALEQQAVLKAKAEEIKRGLKIKSRNKIINKGLLNNEINSLLGHFGLSKKQKELSANSSQETREMDVKTMVGITTDKTEEVLKTTYTITVNSYGKQDSYKTEKYNFGLVYYFKNNVNISEKKYHELLSQYNIPR